MKTSLAGIGLSILIVSFFIITGGWNELDVVASTGTMAVIGIFTVSFFVLVCRWLDKEDLTKNMTPSHRDRINEKRRVEIMDSLKSW